VTPIQRTPELVTEEIRREREELARAVTSLRSDFRAATDVRAILRARWPQIVVAAGFAAGVIAARHALRRRRERERCPEPAVLLRLGRFAVVERD
jgi:hypothetical protein